jgi:hypothetical protein
MSETSTLPFDWDAREYLSNAEPDWDGRAGVAAGRRYVVREVV